MGIVLGLASAALFGLGGTCSKRGMVGRPTDDGMLPMLAVNMGIVGLILPFAPAAAFDGVGFAAFVVGGFLGTFLGRSTNLRAIRRLGPIRANTFLTTTPIVTAIIGWLLLGEALSPLAGAGSAAAIAGLWWMSQPPKKPSATPTSRLRAGAYAAALASPLFFGTAFVLRKFGIEHYASPVVGALVGVAVALVVLLGHEALSRRLRGRLDAYRRSMPWWFVWAGVATGVAVVLQFATYELLPAWTVSLFQATQVLWTLGWSALILRRDETFDRRTLAGIALVVTGIAVVITTV